MVDAIFEQPRLAALYDPLDPDRQDLDAYVAFAQARTARSALDVGCGTGTLACRLARRGLEVVALDPAHAMLEVAMHKASAERVRWLLGDVTVLRTLPRLSVDLVTMTGNVAQVFLTDEDWSTALRCMYMVLAEDGRLVFETRDPSDQAWLHWNRSDTFRRIRVSGIGDVDAWEEVTDVSGDFVSFRSTFVFDGGSEWLVSESTLRFRDRKELAVGLQSAGLHLEEIRDAPDRLGREFVCVARRME